MIVLVVLGASYRATGIDPGLLWRNREKAAHFVAGRPVSEDERAQARARAERLPEMLATEQAREAVRKSYQEKGASPPREPQFGREVAAEAAQILARQPAAERAGMVETEYSAQLRNMRGGFFPPEVRAIKLRDYGTSLLETLAIALWGTLLAVVAAVPLAVLAARNTLEILAPGESWWARALRWASRALIRRFLDACRGFNEFVLALVIVAVIGLGPFTGVLALFIHSTGILGKVLSEAIDAIEPGPVEGVASTGARPLQTVVLSVFPQIMPYLVSNSLLRFETNVRSATILGVVGAGGIGFLMSDKINGYQYREVCTMMLIVLVTVTLIDMACGRLIRAVV